MDLDSHLVLMMMTAAQDLLLLHSLDKILMVKLKPLVFTAVTPMPFISIMRKLILV